MSFLLLTIRLDITKTYFYVLFPSNDSRRSLSEGKHHILLTLDSRKTLNFPHRLWKSNHQNDETNLILKRINKWNFPIVLKFRSQTFNILFSWLFEYLISSEIFDSFRPIQYSVTKRMASVLLKSLNKLKIFIKIQWSYSLQPLVYNLVYLWPWNRLVHFDRFFYSQ